MIDRWDKRPWIQRAGDALSQFLNVWLLNGMPDESISGRTWRKVSAGDPKTFWKCVYFAAEFIFYPIDRGAHCKLAYEEDLERLDLRLQAYKRITHQ